MKKQMVSWLIIVALVALGVLVYTYGSRPEMPQVGIDGKINGNYSIASIQRLGKPYVCNFEKKDGTSQVVGVIHTDGKSVYGEFRIKTDLAEKQFNSFLILKDDESYVWTSLQNVGYKTSIAQSASQNASPQEQAQIVGTWDKINYKCEPWLDSDNSIFETPTWITFVNLK